MTNVFFKKCHAHNVIIPNKGASCPKCVEQQRAKYAGIHADTDTRISNCQYTHLMERGLNTLRAAANYQDISLHDYVMCEIAEVRISQYLNAYLVGPGSWWGVTPTPALKQRILSDIREIVKTEKLESKQRILSDLRELAKAGKLASVR